MKRILLIFGLLLAAASLQAQEVERPAPVDSLLLGKNIFSIMGQYLGNAKSQEEVLSKHLQTGCYLLRIHTSEGIQNKKMVIQ